MWNQRDEGRFLTGSRLEKLAVRQTPCFVSNSRHGAEFLTAKFQVAPQRINIVHNGVELDPPLVDRATWRERIGAEEDCFVACMVANLHSCKDHATLLRAWQTVAQAFDESQRQAMLLLAGRPGDTEHTLKALAYDLELGRSVRFLGGVQDVSGLLQAVDLGVFSSKYEGCPNGVLECMAASLPVAGTEIPGIREAVGPAGYPFLAPPGDDEALSAIIMRLATDEKLRVQLAEQLFHRIEVVFNPRILHETTLQILADGLAARCQEYA